MTKRDILEALGLGTETKEDRFWSGLFMGLGAGMLVGSVTALLLAPRRGSELRSAIGEKSRGVINKLRHKGEEGEAASSSEFGV